MLSLFEMKRLLFLPTFAIAVAVPSKIPIRRLPTIKGMASSDRLCSSPSW
jgi:hypothetical protein